MPERPLHVGLVECASALTGSVASVLHIARVLEGQVHFSWASPPNPDLSSKVERWTPLDAPMPRKQLRTIVTYPTSLVYQAARLARWAQRERLDVLHINDFYNLVGVVAKPLLGNIPLVYHVRLLPDAYLRPVWRPMVRLVSSLADRVLCVSRAVQDALPSPERSVVLPDSMPVPEVPRGPASPQGRPLRVLVLSNFVPGKGQDLALAAFRRALNQAPQLRLRFVGGDLGQPRNRAFREALRRRVLAWGLEDRVEFSGFTPDPGAEYRAADMVLHLSESESFSMVCLEAMMYGVPLIASDCGGPRELFVHGQSGLLVPNRGVDDAASALVRLAQDRALRDALGRAAREEAIRRFAVQGAAARLLSVYRELTGTL
ncbi:MAG: glycosyltransferase family 4 protein [Myxococcales bacterium]|nr:glycosyltransferase family 4 protein [Polyangiaceae bacterium]MDW8251705.1 glycosyltransferase family 4 protein [Myxococcales bacterium]